MPLILIRLSRELSLQIFMVEHQQSVGIYDFLLVLKTEFILVVEAAHVEVNGFTTLISKVGFLTVGLSLRFMVATFRLLMAALVVAAARVQFLLD